MIISYCSFSVVNHALFYILVVLSHFILMAILWRRHWYYSHFIDKETEAQFIWLAHCHSIYKEFKSSTWLLNFHSSANHILSRETLKPFQLKSWTRQGCFNNIILEILEDMFLSRDAINILERQLFIVWHRCILKMFTIFFPWSQKHSLDVNKKRSL